MVETAKLAARKRSLEHARPSDSDRKKGVTNEYVVSLTRGGKKQARKPAHQPVGRAQLFASRQNSERLQRKTIMGSDEQETGACMLGF
ncbi:MAG: hypothetical protein IID30_11020 [Planctomycetes bacterium]|nr:hypothetical protein [Planctomycetota bacterium]